MATPSAAGTSTSAIVSSLVANLILFGLFITCFLILRLKFKRIYSPKSSFDLVPEDKKPEPLPKDPIRWVFILLTKPHSFIIQQAGLDGYFFLRFLLVLAFTFLFGVLIYIVLLPVNVVKGNNHEGFDKLSISNVKHKNRYYAHAFVGWVFYGSYLFVIYRELFFYNSLRSAALSSPRYAKLLSSRTVLFGSVPPELLDEKQFFKMFNGVKRIYVSRTNKRLDYKVNKRQNLAMRLEAVENKLLKKAVRKHVKDTKLHAKDPSHSVVESANMDDYIPRSKRPTTRVGGIFSPKVDLVDNLMEQISQLDTEIKTLQRKHKVSSRPKNSIFVEFEDQYSAQLAHQTVAHHNPYRMQTLGVGLSPGDIIWSNLRMFWWEKVARRFFAMYVLIVLIIIWAIPVAFVGAVSNITYLIDKLPWLGFINNLPKFLRGIVTGLFPTLLLTMLMSFLPVFIRAIGRLSGAPSTQHIEAFTQKAYFGFLIVNAFLITTLSSSAASTITAIIDKPSQAMTILAKQLPTASNFYISYLILQGLSIAGGSLFQVVGLFLYYILGFVLDRTVRKKWARFSGLGSMAWGTTFPTYTNLACITLAYAIISPLILIFAAIAFLMCYVAFCHNLTYCFVESPDSRGMQYPRALFQTFTGIYLGQLCMLGIFVVGKGWGPIVIQAIGLFSTIFCHYHMKEAFDHLLKVIPVDTMRALDGVSQTPSFVGETEYQRKVLDKRAQRADRKKAKNLLNSDTDATLDADIKEDKLETTRVKHELLSSDYELNEAEQGAHCVPLLADRTLKTVESNNVFVRFFRPDVFMNYKNAKKLLPATYNIEPEPQNDRRAYDPPVVSAQLPKLWIPKDPMGLSTAEIERLSKVIEVSDKNARFNAKGKIEFTGPPT
jgi:chaperonin cofactor prefoldin